MKIKLIYFKPSSGKFYTSGEYETQKRWLFEVHGEVAEMREHGKLPGLENTYEPSEFIVLIEGPDMPLQLVGVGEHAPEKKLNDLHRSKLV